MMNNFMLKIMMSAMNSKLGMKLFEFRTNNFVDNLINSGNDVINAAQKIAPIGAAICGVAAALMYMFSDKLSDRAKSWGFRIFISVGIIMGITSIVSWMQNVAKF